MGRFHRPHFDPLEGPLDPDAAGLCTCEPCDDCTEGGCETCPHCEHHEEV